MPTFWRLNAVLFAAVTLWSRPSATSADPMNGVDVMLAPCTSDPTQLFSLITVPPYVNAAAIASHGFCLTITPTGPEPYSNTGVGNPVAGVPCGGNAINARANQYWTVGPTTLGSLQVDTPLCLGAGVLANCTAASAQFTINMGRRSAGTLVQKGTGHCVTLAGPLPPLPPPPGPRPPDPPNTPCPPPPPPAAPTPPPPDVKGSTCDIYAAGGAPCVAAHSMVRALYRQYDGPLYGVRRASDKAFLAINTSVAGGWAESKSQDTFCASTDCVVEIIFDQSPNGNHLRANHPGRHFPVDRGVNASAHPIVVGGQRVYGAWFDEGMGPSHPRFPGRAPCLLMRGTSRYRNDNTTGLAVGDQPQSIYAVFGGGHYNDVCCFDYGNAEDHIGADGPGTMEAIYFGNCTSWWTSEAKSHIPPSWHGPYLMADLEAGMYDGNSSFNPLGTPINYDFVTLMLKGKPCEMSLKAGNAQKGGLELKYQGGRPTHGDWNPMRKQGGLILGTGGDNSDRALGIFYEGAMTAGYVPQDIDDLIQSNVVASGYAFA